jgi:hypothetical protein
MRLAKGVSPVNSVLRFLVAVAGALSSAVPAAWADPLKLTGTVFDSATKLPLEGAYVVAIYEEWRANIGMSTHICVKLKGMTTGPDGRFDFPVEKRNGESPSDAIAIKRGYYLDHLGRMPDPDEMRRQSPAAYANRDIYLTAQNPASPTFARYSLSMVQCRYARTRADAEPGIQYMKIVVEEMRRYGADKQTLSGVEYLIGGLEEVGR